MVYEKLGDTGFTIVGLLPKSELNIAAKNINNWTLLFVFISILASIGLGLFMAIRIGRIIAKIIHTVGLAEKGDLTVNLLLKNKGEFGMMALSIDNMIGNMRGLIQHVKLVSEKVADSSEVMAETSKGVSESAGEISRAIEEISIGSTELAKDAEEGSIKMEQLSKSNKIIIFECGDRGSKSR